MKQFLKSRVHLCACLLWSSAAMAQTPTAGVQQRSFHAPQARVQKALHEIASYPGGKLPVIDGFADPGGHSFDSYKRGYYEYEVKLKSSSAVETTVTVTSKITAWYSGPEGTAGYRLLKSSGRLESDLLDALEDKLNPKPPGSAGRASAPQPRLPDSPSATVGTGSFFDAPRLTSASSDNVPAKAAPTKPTDPATAKRLRELNQQAQNLEQILHDQVRPDNLAVVKRSNTPIVAQPVDGAEVMFQADAEDEFEVLDTTDKWVHIKISDLSRGWVQRDYVDMPGAATVSVAALSDSDNDHERALLRQTKEEIGAFPGQWEQLNGKQVKIIWVQPLDKNQFGGGLKWNMAKSVFRSADAGNPADPGVVSGVVVIFDAQDGGMTATTLANLQQWRAGHLSDETFWRRCWRDPADAFSAGN